MLKDLEQHSELIEPLVRFVEGDIDGEALQKALDDPKLQKILGFFENPRYPASTNYYKRLLKQDRVSLGGLLNSQGIIEGFLIQAEIKYTLSKKYEDLYDLVLDAMPSYLDPSMELIEPLLPDDIGLSKTRKIKLFKERVKALFPCAGRPPKWIQSPDWPVIDGKPLTFIGQITIDAPDLFHDTGVAYLFYSDKEGFETVTQFY